jgi:hypothetical protein
MGGKSSISIAIKPYDFPILVRGKVGGRAT